MPALDSKALVTAQQSDTGLVRATNQDHCAEFQHPSLPRRLLVVADGMGGHRGGEVASRLAVSAIGDAFRASSAAGEEVLRTAFAAANDAIRGQSADNPELAGMGTTAVAVLVDGDDRDQRCWVASVGDSRVYLLHEGAFRQLTDDHSVVGELVRRGHISDEEARNHPRRNEILRALGTQPEVETDVIAVEAAGGDHFVLCSDGLSGMLLDEEIAETVEKNAPAEAVAKLVEMANECGGTDNITVQIARIEESSAPADGGDDEPADTTALRVRWALTLAAIVGVLWLLVHQL